MAWHRSAETNKSNNGEAEGKKTCQLLQTQSGSSDCAAKPRLKQRSAEGEPKQRPNGMESNHMLGEKEGLENAKSKRKHDTCIDSMCRIKCVVDK